MKKHKSKVKQNDDIFALRLFINGKRIKSHKLNKKQARTFFKTSLHLAKYLIESYKLG